VHGTAADDNAYLLEEVLHERLVLARAAIIGTRLNGKLGGVLLCGHSHLPRIVQSEGVLIVNPGSVGCPAYSDPTAPAHVSEAGSPHARYALLSQAADAWSIDLIAIRYDWHVASRRAAENGRSECAHALATGFIG
jgi:predicted phosphodiesterase